MILDPGVVISMDYDMPLLADSIQVRTVSVSWSAKQELLH